MTKAVHTFRIRRLLSRIHSSLYSNAPPQACCTGKHGHAAQIQALRAELEAWRAETPPLPQYPHEALALFSTPDWFDLEYNYTLLQLYRVEIIDYQRRDKNHPSSTTTTTNTETDTETTFLTVLHAASAICTSYRRQFLRNRPTMSYTWTALHELFLAGLTYCHCLWTSPAARRLYRYRYPGAVSRTCTDATVVLVLIAERWAGAAVYRNLFGVLAQRTAGMLDGDGEENGEAGEAEESWDKRETERDNDGEEQFGEWMARAAETGMSEGFEALLNSFAGEFSSESGFV